MSNADDMRCPLCGRDNRKTFEVITQEAGAERRCLASKCSCGLAYLVDYEADRSAIYGDDYTVWSKSREAEEPVIASSKRAAFTDQLASLLPFIDPKSKRLLDIGTGKGYLLDVAARMGFDCYGLELSPYAAGKASERFPGRITTGTIERSKYESGFFDVVTLTDLIEHVGDPKALMAEIRRILKPGGLIFVITPNVGSWTRRLFGKRWFQYKYEHVIYWDPRSLRKLFKDFGFETLALRGNRKRFRLSYYNDYFRKYAFLGPVGRMFPKLYRILPKAVKEMSFSNPITGEMLAIARRDQRSSTAGKEA